MFNKPLKKNGKCWIPIRTVYNAFVDNSIGVDVSSLNKQYISLKSFVVYIYSTCVPAGFCEITAKHKMYFPDQLPSRLSGHSFMAYAIVRTKPTASSTEFKHDIQFHNCQVSCLLSFYPLLLFSHTLFASSYSPLSLPSSQNGRTKIRCI